MSRQDEPTENTQSSSENPPIFTRWAGMYALVIGNLIFLIFLFYLLTAHYA